MLGRPEFITAEAQDMPLWGTALVESATEIVVCWFHHNLGTSVVRVWCRGVVAIGLQ